MEIDLHGLMVFVGFSLVVISFVAVHKMANKEIEDQTVPIKEEHYKEEEED